MIQDLLNLLTVSGFGFQVQFWAERKQLGFLSA